MIVAVGCLLIALACQDVERVAGPTTNPPKANVVATPPVLLSLTCTLDRKSTAISCKPAIPSSAAGVSASVIYGATATYAIFFPYNLVKDTVAHTWAFTAYLQNLLKQSIGTLNGTTVTGVKVFITDFHATTGTGTVSVANADGNGNFTAPNQPYFNYNQIVASSAYSSNKLWKFNVPNTVTAVSMSILLSTDFPAEQNVTALPPATKPAWFNDDSSWAGPHHDDYLKRVITLWFKEGTTLQDRQLAVAYVNGTIVGGGRLSSGDGVYYVQVADDGSGTQLGVAVARLKGLSQVEAAAPTFGGTPGYLKPSDGAGWTKWGLSPDTIGAEDNWALEAINAPMAWGCSTGSSDAQVSVIDHAFFDAELSQSVVSGASNLNAYPGDTIQHGALVGSIMAAHGNDSVGITGVMWRSGLRLVELGSYHASFADYGLLIEQEGAKGVKVVNLSYWKNWHRIIHIKADSDSVFSVFSVMMPAIRRANNSGHLPLIVTIAGDSNYDAFQSVTPILHDSMPLRSLIVAGSTRQRTHSTAWSSYGRLVDVYAPGEDVTAEQVRGGALVQVGADGTSLAAPLVAGTAGLLMSFDSTISVDSLRAYILEGAARGGRSITAPGGTTRYLINAYESLKRAAERPGAPLCGNRIWGNGEAKQLVVQRGSGTEVLVSSTTNSFFRPAVYHGGKQITFLEGLPEDQPRYPFLPDDDGWHAQCYAATWSDNGTWTVSPPRCDTRDPSVGVGLPPLPGTLSGSANSRLGISHGGDSAVTVVGCLNQPGCFNVNLNNTHLATLTRAADPSGTVVAIAYSPYGDRVLIALSTFYSTLFEPINIAYSGLKNPTVYSVHLRDGQVTTLTAWNTAGKGIYWLSLSEDGRTAVAGTGQYYSPLDTNTPCFTEYRDYSGAPLSPPVPPIEDVYACKRSEYDEQGNRSGSAAARLVASAPSGAWTGSASRSSNGRTGEPTRRNAP